MKQLNVRVSATSELPLGTASVLDTLAPRGRCARTDEFPLIDSLFGFGEVRFFGLLPIETRVAEDVAVHARIKHS
jgi:hypothetical protein